MRTIKFRGKSLHDNKWVYGSYLYLKVPQHYWTNDPMGKAEDVHYIVEPGDINHAVNPGTVGQFTGLKDKSGLTEIYEDDIVKSPEWDNATIVEYDEIQESDDMTAPGMGFQFSTYPEKMEVIGNIHDNPELIKELKL